jgi:hypothetical protein
VVKFAGFARPNSRQGLPLLRAERRWTVVGGLAEKAERLKPETHSLALPPSLDEPQRAGAATEAAGFGDPALQGRLNARYSLLDARY